MSFVDELKRRNVIRVALAYLVFAWLMLQVGDVLFPALHLPEWSITLLAILLAIGFVVVVVFSWVFELTPEGIRRERDVPDGASITPQTGKRLNGLIIILLAIAIAMLGYQAYVADPATVVSSDDSDGRTFIAVLPFKATGSDDGGFLAAGLHDDLLTMLAKLDAFSVISRTSMMEYAETTKNMREIGLELGADYILEGGVQAHGDRVRINAQLINADTDEHIWADTYDRSLTAGDLFDVQSELAKSISTQLNISLSPEDVEVVTAMPTENIDAYNAYLRAGQRDVSGISYSVESTTLAIEDGIEAVTLDPDFALAWARLSDSYSRRVRVGNVPGDAQKALEAFARARALQPDLLETELAWAVYLYHSLDEFEQALRALDNLPASANGSAAVVALRAYLYRRLGRFEEAYQTLLAAERLDPRSLLYPTTLVDMAVWTGRCDAARTHSERGIELDPDSTGAKIYVARYELECGSNLKRADAIHRDTDFDTDWQLWTARQVALVLGNEDRMLELAMIDLPERNPLADVTNQLHRAEILKYLGRAQEAQPYIERAAAILDGINAVAGDELYVSYARSMEYLNYVLVRPQETRYWMTEKRRIWFRPDNLDHYVFTNFAPFDAATLATVGLHDEAVELLREMFELGGHTWKFVDDLPLLDVLDGHPGFDALRRQYGD